MIRGLVNANLEATIELAVLGSEGEKHRIEAVVDTGFNGSLMLPARLLVSLRCARIGHTRAMLADGSEKVFDLYAATVIWQGRPRPVSSMGRKSSSFLVPTANMSPPSKH